MNSLACLFCLLSLSVFGQSTQPASAPVEKEPHPDRGVYAIWYQGGREYLLDLPFIKGGQVFAQWGEIEKTEGEYDWSKLDEQLKMLHERGMRATVQINGNIKPDWMFEKIPYWPGKLPQAKNKQGAPMYWHPDFIKAYFRFLQAQADYVRNSPYRDAVLAMRMNFAAIGNEYLNAKQTGTDLSKWVVPSGANKEGMRVWDESVSTEYEKLVGAEYVKIFLPDIFVFVRAHMDQEARPPILKYFEEGKMGWFHTGAQVIEPKIEWWQNLYRTFYDYCRMGTTLGYAEPISDAFGYHGMQNKLANPRAGAQWNYWRLLIDLQYGIDFIACYGHDLQIAYDGTHFREKDIQALQDEYMKAFQFTSKYAGYLNSPKHSPGAWVAMRQLKRKPGEEKLHFTDDCAFLMTRLPDNSTGVEKVGPEEQRFGGWARVMPKGEAMKFDIDDRFAEAIKGQPTKINVIVFGDKDAKLSLKGAGQSFEIELKNTGRWETFTFDITASQFASEADGADLALVCPDADVTVHMIEVTKIMPEPESWVPPSTQPASAAVQE